MPSHAQHKEQPMSDLTTTSSSRTETITATTTGTQTLTETDTSEASLVAAYPTHHAAEEAVRALHKAGLDLQRLSILGRGMQTEEHAVGFYTSQDRMKFWGGAGVMWGSLYGLLLGSALFLLPVTGPLVVMGPLVGVLAGAIEGAAVGGSLGVLAAALASLGIPEDSVVRYEVEVKEGHYLLVVRGTPAIITHAHVCLEGTGATALTEHIAEERQVLALPT
jgi:uncharacterized membrane protein